MQKNVIKLLTTADIFSILNALFGFTAIVFTVKNSFWIAASFVFLAMLGDGADGLIARRLHSGKLGESLDSLADFTAFSIAPSLIILEKNLTNDFLPLFLPLLFYLITSILRLSAFPVLKQKDKFIGLPIPSAGATLVLLVLLHFEWYIIVTATLILSLLMVSPIGFPKPGKIPSITATALIIGTLLLKNQYNYIMPSLLFTALLIYTTIGPIYIKFYQKK